MEENSQNARQQRRSSRSKNCTVNYSELNICDDASNDSQSANAKHNKKRRKAFNENKNSRKSKLSEVVKIEASTCLIKKTDNKETGVKLSLTAGSKECVTEPKNQYKTLQGYFTKLTPKVQANTPCKLYPIFKTSSQTNPCKKDLITRSKKRKKSAEAKPTQLISNEVKEVVEKAEVPPKKRKVDDKNIEKCKKITRSKNEMRIKQSDTLVKTESLSNINISDGAPSTVTKVGKKLKPKMLHKKIKEKPPKLYPLFTKLKQTQKNDCTNAMSRKLVMKSKVIVTKTSKTKRSNHTDKTCETNNNSDLGRNDTDNRISEIEIDSICLSDQENDSKPTKSSTLDSTSDSVAEKTQTSKVLIQKKTYKNTIDTFPFPSVCHCGKSEMKIDLNCKINAKHEADDHVKIPLWSTIAGVTDISTIPEFACEKICKEDSEIVASNEAETACESFLFTDTLDDYIITGNNEKTINELTVWLSQWKEKFTKDSKKKSTNEDSCDRFSCDSNDSDSDSLSNSIILVGPPGCGKTSLVFSSACKNGFKVLEVNASSNRSGRNVSHQLKEALESYHMEHMKHNEISKSVNKQEHVTNKNGIAGFFQKKTDSGKTSQNAKRKKIKQENTAKSNTEPTSNYSISSHTIILFDDIDVVFPEDEGLWSTIRGFLKISKKPVIFTVSRNLEMVKSNLDLDIPVLTLKSLDKAARISKMESQCNKFNMIANVNLNILANVSNDIRRNLLQTQFWCIDKKETRNLAAPSPVKTDTYTLHDMQTRIFKGALDLPIWSGQYLPISSKIDLEGYDLLHANFYPLINIFHSGDDKTWPKAEKLTISKPSSTSPSSPTDLWKEACQIFECKKSALDRGNPSKELFSISRVLSDFSYVDALMGFSRKQLKHISQSQRGKQWSAGLPVYDMDSCFATDDLMLEASSFIQMSSLRNNASNYYKEDIVDSDRNQTFSYEEFFKFDHTEEEHCEEQLEIIASALPSFLCLSKDMLSLDYLSSIKVMSQLESERQSSSSKRSHRFLHYFDSISLLLEKQHIAKILN